MGLKYTELLLLAECRSNGTELSDVLTIGRQSLNLHPKELRALDKHRLICQSLRSSLSKYKWGDYCDRVLREGFSLKSLDVLDYSNYEGATRLHDLNTPVPQKWLASYDAVIDGGSLEHVFNLPIALKNLMGMVRPGGVLLLSSPANNLCGHGFYQFSPELVFRALSPENGYRVERILLVEYWYPSVEIRPYRRMFEVVDPSSLGRRIMLQTRRPTMMVVVGRRLRLKEIFANTPLQSDYQVQWDVASDLPRSGGGLVSRYGALLPRVIRLRLRGFREQRLASWSDSRAFRPCRL